MLILNIFLIMEITFHNGSPIHTLLYDIPDDANDDLHVGLQVGHKLPPEQENISA